MAERGEGIGDAKYDMTTFDEVLVKDLDRLHEEGQG